MSVEIRKIVIYLKVILNELCKIVIDALVIIILRNSLKNKPSNTDYLFIKFVISFFLL